MDVSNPSCRHGLIIGGLAAAVVALALALVLTSDDNGGSDASAPTSANTAPENGESEPLSSPLTIDSPISTQGIGPILAGMSLEDAEAAGNIDLKFNVDGPSGECHYATTSALADVSFMFTGDELARVDVMNPAVRTISGLGVGSTESEVLAEYGNQIETTPHEYVPGGNYLTYIPANGDGTRVVFETDGQAVTLIRAGRLPQVEYIEGCA